MGIERRRSTGCSMSRAVWRTHQGNIASERKWLDGLLFGAFVRWSGNLTPDNIIALERSCCRNLIRVEKRRFRRTGVNYRLAPLCWRVGWLDGNWTSQGRFFGCYLIDRGRLWNARYLIVRVIYYDNLNIGAFWECDRVLFTRPTSKSRTQWTCLGSVRVLTLLAK